MSIIELFKDSLSYPTKDIDKLLTLGVLFLFEGILSLLPSLTAALNQEFLTQILYFISNIVGILVIFISFGYIVSIIKYTIYRNVDIPSLEIIKNFSNGTKVFLIFIVYYIIPLVITLLFAYILGAFDIILELIRSFFYFSPEISFYSYSMVLNIPNIVLLPIVAIILSIVSTLFFVIAVARFADFGSIKHALNFKAVILDIEKILWINYIVLSIILAVILMVILFFTLIISIVPFFGFILLFLVILPFLSIFYGRTVGLIYKKSKI